MDRKKQQPKPKDLRCSLEVPHYTDDNRSLQHPGSCSAITFTTLKSPCLRLQVPQLFAHLFLGGAGAAINLSTDDWKIPNFIQDG